MELIRIPLHEINLSDRSLKVSRNRVDQGFRASIREFGILDPPVVIGERGPFRVVFGHNRLGVLAELGGSHAWCERRSGLDAEWYPGRAVLKCMRNEAGPAGRLRILLIVKDVIGVDPCRLRDFASRGLMIPPEYADDCPLLERTLAFPGPLLEYLDCRDVPFRVIRELARLTARSVALLSDWVAAGPLKLNIFRSLVAMLADIEERGGPGDVLGGLAPADGEDRARWEERLHASVFALRYPGFASARAAAEEVTRYYDARGIRVDCPPYFEGNTLTLSLSLKKGEDPWSLRGRFEGVDLDRLKELLALL